jgi:hypothetical protein
MAVCYSSGPPDGAETDEDLDLPFNIHDLPPEIRQKIDEIVRNNESLEAQIDAIDELLFGKLNQRDVGSAKNARALIPPLCLCLSIIWMNVCLISCVTWICRIFGDSLLPEEPS